MKNRITGRSAFLALLKDEGITHLFGNPGTTELPIMHALKDHPDLTYVMAMQESLVVAIADGFSRASGRLVACNVHVAPGLGNAMGSLYNAQFTGTPMILTAGQQEQGHGLTEPLLYAPLSLSPMRVSRKPRVQYVKKRGMMPFGEARRNTVGADRVPHADAFDRQVFALVARDVVQL